MLNVGVVAFEALAVATVAPRAARELGGIELFGWTFAAFMLASLVSVVIAGHAADGYGPRGPLAIGLAIFTLGLVICGSAPSMPLFIVGRAVQGLGAGAMLATAYVAIGRAFDERERPHQFALLSTAWIVPGLVAPALAGLITDMAGWRFVFIGLIGLPIVAAWLSLPAMNSLHDGTGESTGALPMAAAMRLATGAGLIIAGLGASQLWVAAALSVAGVLIAVPAFRALTPPGTLRARAGLPAVLATRGLETFAFFGANAFLALALEHVRDLSAISIGIVLTPATLLWTCGSWIQARRVGRWTRRAMVGTGTAGLGAAIAGSTCVLLHEVPIELVAVVWGVAGLAMGLSYPTTSVAALSVAPSGKQGAATASLQVCDVLGQGLGTGMGGALLLVSSSSGLARRDGLALVFALMVLAAFLAFIAARRFPDDPPGLWQE